MKAVTLLKQKLLYKKEEESADFQRLKRETLEMKEHLEKAAGFLKAWLEGAKAMQKASKEMSEVFNGEDADLEAIATVVSDGLANTQTGAGVVEVALDSVTKKIGWINDLKKKCASLDTAHLELSRANRKLADAKDPAKQATASADQQRCQEVYDKLHNELDASFRFVMEEAKQNSPTGEAHPLGLLHSELSAFKQSQVEFYRSCNNVTSTFQLPPRVDIANVWTDFQDRRIAAIDKAASSGGKAQSGRDLFREGLTGAESSSPSSRQLSESSRTMSRRGAPPPPPPPPPSAPKSTTYTALYDYQAADADELSFSAGTPITIIDKSDPNWWRGEDGYGNAGLVPSNYFQV